MSLLKLFQRKRTEKLDANENIKFDENSRDKQAIEIKSTELLNQIAKKNVNGEKSREFKGKSIKKHIDDYCIIDLETTSIVVTSAKIVEISAIKVRDNKVVQEFSTLINPKCHIPAEATSINNITDDMVKDAPTIDAVIDQFLEFVGDDVIVGYNNAAFDMNLIYDNVQTLRNIHFSNDYIDILHAVRRSLYELDNSKLETVSKYFALDVSGEHRALKDCYLTKEVYDRLNVRFGDSAFNSSIRNSGKYGVQYSAKTLALQEMKLFLEMILEDGIITEEEVNSLQGWIDSHRELSGCYPFDKVFNVLDDVLEDGSINDEEMNTLETIFAEIIDPVKNKGFCEEIGSIDGMHICLTGDFEYGSRNAVEELITSLGGIVDESIKKATNYLIVGALGSAAWKSGNYGGKVLKAMERNEKGQNIKIVEESKFISSIKNNNVK